MRPTNLKTKIFLDSGDPQDTKKALELLDFLDGQTTNPSLIAKNPELKEKLGKGDKLNSEDINNFYKGVVQEISEMIPDGSVSIEVYADNDTSLEKILNQARTMNTWINNAHIKLPITYTGLEAAEILTKENVRVNMTLCFSQAQAAAVYSATQGVQKGDVFLSPFIGRLDDRGENGMSLIANMAKMFSQSDGHVQVLAASIRNYDHFKASLALGVDIITCPLKILEAWKDNNFEIPDDAYIYNEGNMKNIVYDELLLDKPWREYDIVHDLTDAGLKKFADDWNALISA